MKCAKFKMIELDSFTDTRLQFCVSTMQRKLKRNKNIKDPATKDQPTEVIVLSSCSEDEQHPERRTCGEGLKTAPIFLRTNQLRRRKRSSHGGSDRQAVHRSELLPPDVVRSPPSVSKGPEVSSWRGHLLPSSCLQRSVLEEIRASNPAFPLHTVFSSLQKKTGPRLQDLGSSDSSQKSLNEKRKRGNEISERCPKRLCAEAGTGFCPLSGQDVQERTVLGGKEQSGGSKLSDTYRREHQSERMDQTESATASDVIHGDFCPGELLWTDKYSPRHSGEVIGHSAAVNKLHSWLKKWKLRADSDERRKAEERKREELSLQISDSWDCGDFQGEALLDNAGEELLRNAMLLTGPPGVGKTASVYACAQELGFKVFEVNCSSQRSGRLVLSQLKEATQSHLVEASGEGPLKPAYFNNYSANSCTPKPEALLGKLQLPRSTPFALKRKAARNSGSRRRAKAKAAAVTLAHYFKMKQKADHFHVSGTSQSGKCDCWKPTANTLQGCDKAAPQGRKTATSLILFEEVDVIFEDDVGFLAAVKAFMTTTKRPVVLTTNDPSFKEKFDCSLEEILFKTPSAVNVCSYLQLVCLAEEVRADPDDISSLFRLTCGDVRRCLLQLQLWVHSGGGCVPPIVGQNHLRHSETSVRDGSDPQLPAVQTGCSACMLGLHPVTLNYLLNFLKSQSWPQTDVEGLLKLLAESWRRDLPLLYSNLELLLSVGAAETSPHHPENKTDSQLQTEPRRSDTDPHTQKPDQNPVPKASVSCSKPVRTVSRLSRKRYAVLAKPDLTVEPQKTPSSLRETQPGARRLSNDGLEALADFFDLMSCIDALPDAGRPVSGSRRCEAFVWTRAAVKDGLLDEISEEGGESRDRERLQGIKAAAEGFGFHRCWWRMSKARKYKQEEDKEWKRPQNKLLLASSSKQHSLSFTAQPLWASSLSERSYKVSRMVLSSKSFSLLGNRRAVAVDYMPVLRFFCARQKADLGSIRSLNHQRGAHLGLSRSTVQLLAEDFTLKTVWKNT